ncbi:MAG TPA: hypothetical protein VMU60_04920 [Syntrophobacteria bacterium]|nr:hypothetical protein [Syntrophobacteria bacterium]
MGLTPLIARLMMEQVQSEEQNEATVEEQSVDLNRVFTEARLDLNAMFPDEETRQFLQEIDRNRRSNQRFLEAFKKDKVWETDD